MDIKPEHIASKKQVGKLKGQGVFEMKTTGGLCLIMSNQNGKASILGVGPHRGVARYIAEKKEPSLEWTELSKADYAPYDSFAFILPKYEALTEEFRKAANGNP